MGKVLLRGIQLHLVQLDQLQDVIVEQVVAYPRRNESHKKEYRDEILKDLETHHKLLTSSASLLLSVTALVISFIALFFSRK